jgi:REP element-mobilizing transposase RayT
MATDIQRKPVRNPLRLKGFDYSEPGAYFITICTENGVCYLGNIVDGITISYPLGDVIREIWQEIPEKFQCVDIDAFIIMPNHVHGVVIINEECRDMVHRDPVNSLMKDDKVGLINQTPTINQAHTKNHLNDKKRCLANQAPTKNHYKTKNWILMQNSNQTVGKIIRYFKAKTAKTIHDRFFPSFQWQRNYYEHVVRSPRELNSIREYIINNPLKWALDRENRLSKNFNMDLDNYFKEIYEK